MDLKERLCSDMWAKSSSSANDLPRKGPPDKQPFPNFNSQQRWEDPLDVRMDKQFSELNQPSETPSSFTRNTSNHNKIPGPQDSQMEEFRDTNKIEGWDPRMMLSNLSFMEQKIHQLQHMVHLIVGRRAAASLGQSNELVTQQQQLITADLTSIIIQLISTAGSLLPLVKHIHSSVNASVGQLGEPLVPPVAGPSASMMQQNINSYDVKKAEDQSKEAEADVTTGCGVEQIYVVEEHVSKDEEDGDEGENLPPGSYEILQLEKEEILAPHTHFCMICGKGFKRDANLRMHMRGHGDEYKTAAALAKPHTEASSEPLLTKRYSCPYAGCKRNKDHKKFQPLKTILCVKNHFKRTHCDKSYTCSRCNTKKFSVIADLKTHEKHCGRDKWLCSCGTTFSRKDKLFGHISLFQGHTPALPLDESKGLVGLSDGGDNRETPHEVPRLDFTISSSNTSVGNVIENAMDVRGGVGVDPASYFSPLSFDTCNLSGYPDFPRPPFEDSQSPFSFLFPGSCSYPQTSRGESGPSDLQ